MTSVTIDLADLETLVMATGVIKTIEGALAQRKSDAFVKPHLDFTAAHDRCAAAMRNARRADAGTLVPWDGDLDAEEERLLRKVDESEVTIYFFSGNKSDYVSLEAKGCVQIGQAVRGVIWAGDKQAELKPYAEYAVRITQRGRDTLRFACWRGSEGTGRREK